MGRTKEIKGFVCLEDMKNGKLSESIRDIFYKGGAEDRVPATLTIELPEQKVELTKEQIEKSFVRYYHIQGSGSNESIGDVFKELGFTDD